MGGTNKRKIKFKTIKIKPKFFKKLNYKISLPTIKCAKCGEEILDTPEHRLNNFAYERGEQYIKNIIDYVNKL